MTYEENLEDQLKMLDITWEAFKEHGVTEDTEIILEFSYIAPNKEQAKSLSDSIEDYDSSIRSEGLLKKKLFVEGQTHPTNVSKEILIQWIDFMVALGWDHGCEFDGFGASMP